MQEWVSVTNKLEGAAQISFQIHKKMFVVDTQEYFCDWHTGIFLWATHKNIFVTDTQEYFCDWHTACVTQEFLGGEDNLNFIFAFAF